ncbi:hypothetical protein BDQ12DRAFT_723390 [Crucibulum laeve]|uniref:Uncharacterized protein n=1 Tax=Crucibulum laeve TaxID=68775 RepID=A0A5C3M1E7_9AGAR|nr:hypothetical protein BDQ12DRAFT_723390 [Crucibulum laeve]
MTDLTVLVSPTPLYPSTAGFTFGRSPPRPVSRPIMVTLESESHVEENEGEAQLESSPTPQPPPRKSRSPRHMDSSLLSPPINTWKSPQERSQTRHRPTRSQSAPPERRVVVDEAEFQEKTKSWKDAEALTGFLEINRRSPKRSLTSFAASTRGGELVPPPPPLLRPTTFWRKTRRSGVTGASYSPSSHLIRRSTYIAAGLTFDAPVHDLSALCVESRVGYIVIPPDQKLQ